MVSLCEFPRVVKFVKTKLVSSYRGVGENEKLFLNDYRVSGFFFSFFYIEFLFMGWVSFRNSTDGCPSFII